jgi:hypothetical protein
MVSLNATLHACSVLHNIISCLSGFLEAASTRHFLTEVVEALWLAQACVDQAVSCLGKARLATYGDEVCPAA